MFETIVRIEGMACSMCESHINSAVRKTLPVKKVTSSHAKGQTVILSEAALDESALRKAVADTGYQVLSLQSRPYQKKGLFSFGK